MGGLDNPAFKQLSDQFKGEAYERIPVEERQQLLNHLYRVGMGYVGVNEKAPLDSVKWLPERHSFIHEFSLKTRAYNFAYYRLKEFMGLDEYLNLPAHRLDDIMEGLREGAAQRFKDNPPTPELPEPSIN